MRRKVRLRTDYDVVLFSLYCLHLCGKQSVDYSVDNSAIKKQFSSFGVGHNVCGGGGGGVSTFGVTA